MILTALNGSKVIVQSKHVASYGPHIEGGSFIKIGSVPIHVTETPEKITQLMKNDR